MATSDVDEEWLLGRPRRRRSNFFCFNIKRIKTNGPFCSFESCHNFLQGSEVFRIPHHPVKRLELGTVGNLEWCVCVAGDILVLVGCKEVGQCLNDRPVCIKAVVDHALAQVASKNMGDIACLVLVDTNLLYCVVRGQIASNSLCEAGLVSKILPRERVVLAYPEAQELRP